MTFENYQKYSVSIQINELLNLHHEFTISTSLVGSNKQESHIYSSFKSLHGFGAKRVVNYEQGCFLKQLALEIERDKVFYFVCFGYDLKNEMENLESRNKAILDLPDSFVFEPQFVILENQEGEFYLYVQNEAEKAQFDRILLKCLKKSEKAEHLEKIELLPQITKQEYLQGFQRVKHHIQQGDFYEINYCQAFIQENIFLEPLQLFKRVKSIANAPFMVFLKKENQYLVSASPERFIKKEGTEIISQPIKGTVKRGHTKAQDEENKTFLQNSLKEKTENVMIVDLVRNDFGKICKAGSVKVVELFEVYSYPTVHQLVSTVVGELKDGIRLSDILRATFPMGSMTGAPKYRVMQLTDEIESFKRTWYSGSVGYILPTGDFDFNVIIRSFLYDENEQKLFYGVGGGITAASLAENEYEECLLKVNSLVDKLNEDASL